MARRLTDCVALLRGVNVGRAKRVAMADLRAMVEGLGHENVRTVLNSGNVLFRSRSADTARIAGAIAAGIEGSFGFSAAVVVITAAELEAIVAEDLLRALAHDPSRYLVAFVPDPAALAKAGPLAAGAWAPEAIAIGARAAYLWCANGVADSKLAAELTRRTGGAVTARNWATVLKLRAALGAGENAA
jgi:uncharacterized protein (DUF1697 family)